MLNMFARDAQQSQPATPAATPPEVFLGDVRIHTMPASLLSARAVLRDERAEAMSVPLGVQVPEVAAPVVPAESAVAVDALEPPSHRRRWLVLVAVVLLFGATGAVFAYVQVQNEAAAPAPVVNNPTPSPTPAPAPAPVPTPEPQPVPVPTTPVPGIDTDSDGLTDAEEIIYTTNVRNPDSDGDTFLDGNEVFHRYDPNGLSPRTLLQTGTVKEYVLPESGVTLYYPASWTISRSENGVSFAPASQESVISLSVQPKDAAQSLEAWYASASDLPQRTARDPYATKEGLMAVSAADDRLVVLDGGDKVFLMRYDLGTFMRIEYFQTFKMMVNSLRKN